VNEARSTEAALTIAFVVEQHLGHRTYAENLARAMAAMPGVQATWIPVRYEHDVPWSRWLPSEQLRAVLRGRAEVHTGLRRAARDVTVFNTQVPAVISGRIARRAPYVLCADVTPIQYDRMAAGYDHRADRPGPGRWVKYRWNRSVFQRAAAHAPWSSWVRDSLVQDYGVEPGRIAVIPPGVDTTQWQPAQPVGDGVMRILFVGGDFERKGGDLLMRAVASLPTGSYELHVVTRSDVPRRDGVVVHHGLNQNDPELRRLFARSDVFVLPSHAETFGIAAVEGAAAGLPLVLSSIGGLADLVVDGVTGFAVPPGDGDALAIALRRLLDAPDLRRTMGHAARERATREFDATTNARRLVHLCASCAGLTDHPAPVGGAAR